MSRRADRRSLRGRSAGRARRCVGVAGDRVEVGQHLVHAAELGVEHASAAGSSVSRSLRNFTQSAMLREHVERLGVAGEQVHVEQARP